MKKHKKQPKTTHASSAVTLGTLDLRHDFFAEYQHYEGNCHKELKDFAKDNFFMKFITGYNFIKPDRIQEIKDEIAIRLNTVNLLLKQIHTFKTTLAQIQAAPQQSVQHAALATLSQDIHATFKISIPPEKLSIPVFDEIEQSLKTSSFYYDCMKTYLKEVKKEPRAIYPASLTKIYYLCHSLQLQNQISFDRICAMIHEKPATTPGKKHKKKSPKSTQTISNGNYLCEKAWLDTIKQAIEDCNKDLRTIKKRLPLLVEGEHLPFGKFIYKQSDIDATVLLDLFEEELRNLCYKINFQNPSATEKSILELQRNIKKDIEKYNILIKKTDSIIDLAELVEIRINILTAIDKFSYLKHLNDSVTNSQQVINMLEIGITLIFEKNDEYLEEQIKGKFGKDADIQNITDSLKNKGDLPYILSMKKLSQCVRNDLSQLKEIVTKIKTNQLKEGEDLIVLGKSMLYLIANLADYREFCLIKFNKMLNEGYCNLKNCGLKLDIPDLVQPSHPIDEPSKAPVPDTPTSPKAEKEPTQPVLSTPTSPMSVSPAKRAKEEEEDEPVMDYQLMFKEFKAKKKSLKTVATDNQADKLEKTKKLHQLLRETYGNRLKSDQIDHFFGMFRQGNSTPTLGQMFKVFARLGGSIKAVPGGGSGLRLTFANNGIDYADGLHKQHHGSDKGGPAPRYMLDVVTHLLEQAGCTPSILYPDLSFDSKQKIVA